MASKTSSTKKPSCRIELPMIKNRRALRGPYFKTPIHANFTWVYRTTYYRRQCLIISNSYFGSSADIPSGQLIG
ncbi:MAG: hypothetical protein ABFD83_11540 [Armatimonadota bacterium]